MESFIQVYENKSIYFWIASISTGVYLLKLLSFSLFGISDDCEADFHQDDHFGSEASFQLLTTQTFIIFFMSVGWLGFALTREFSLPRNTVAGVAIAFGLAMMVFAGLMARYLKHLNQVPLIQKELLLGKTARTYLTIPPMGLGEGKVEVVLGGGKKVVRAINEGLEEIPSFVEVEITGIENNCFVVKKFN